MALGIREDAPRNNDCGNRWENITLDISDVNIYLEISTKNSTIRNRVNEK